MSREVEGIGKTYEEAVKDGLNKIGLSKNQVTIEEIKEHKKTFFSILEPRVVKVKLIEIENKIEEKVNNEKEIKEISNEDIEKAKNKTEKFISEFLEKLGISLNVKIEYKNGELLVDIVGEKAGLIIGYRGETIEALQTILNTVVNKNSEVYIRVLIDSEGYRKKRIKTLEDLAIREANKVVNRRRNVTLEPMNSFERRAIHTALQNHPKVKSLSVGEEPYRKVVISLK